MAEHWEGFEGAKLVANALRGGEGSIDETLYGKAQRVETAGGMSSEDDPGVHGRFDRIRFCHWAAPEYGPQGESLWTMLFQAAELGVALLNASIQGQISDLNEDLAEGYYQQAKYKWDRFANNYMPLEKEILWEASSTPIKQLDCDDDRNRTWATVPPAFDYMDKYMQGMAERYHLCLDPTVVSQLDYARNLLWVDTENYNLRDDQWFTDFKNDQRWNRRSNILNLGRNLGAVAMQYGDVARKLAGDVSDIANKAAGSLSQALGYYGARFDTVYPTTYLGGQAQGLVGVSARAQRGDPYEAVGSTYGV